MSMSKCKCDKIFDTDDELEHDEKGECCCDQCYEDMANTFEIDLLESIDGIKGLVVKNVVGHDPIGTLSDILLSKGYRKVY